MPSDKVLRQVKSRLTFVSGVLLVALCFIVFPELGHVELGVRLAIFITAVLVIGYVLYLRWLGWIGPDANDGPPAAP